MLSPTGIKGAGKDIFVANFADYLPEALKHDPKIRAIAEAVAKEALAVSKEIENVLIYSRIDDLPEELVDILAYDMHVDWYNYSYPLNIKQNVVKGSVKVHKKMGTKYAVEKAISAVYKNAVVEEWFEYGGNPYMFRITINIGYGGMPEKESREVIRNMKTYKNLRSHCECICYKMKSKRMKVKVAAVHKIGAQLKVRPLLPESILARAPEKVAATIKMLNNINVERR